VPWSIVVKEKSTGGSPFFGAFPSDGIRKATKDVIVHFFIHSNNSLNYNSKFRELAEGTHVNRMLTLLVVNAVF
jgi:hypothetical protein